MKKNYLIFNKSISVLIILFLFNILIYISANIATKANANTDSNAMTTILSYENQQLRNNYKILEQRLDSIEKQLNTIDEHDKYIYSQLLGLNIDSTELKLQFQNIEFDSIDVDSIFIKLDKRAMYMSKIASNQLNKFVESKEIINGNKNILNLYPNKSPIQTKDIIEISSGFGWRVHPIYKTPLFHARIDIAVKLNTNVYSTMRGKVIDVKYSKYGYGNKIVIKNSAGFETLYAHLSEKIYVKKGQIVNKGQLIATSGNSGTSTGPHLHYEIRNQNQLKDPLAYFYTHLTNELLIAEK